VLGPVDIGSNILVRSTDCRTPQVYNLVDCARVPQEGVETFLVGLDRCMPVKLTSGAREASSIIMNSYITVRLARGYKATRYKAESENSTNRITTSIKAESGEAYNSS
jgi:hypothetical protein